MRKEKSSWRPSLEQLCGISFVSCLARLYLGNTKNTHFFLVWLVSKGFLQKKGSRGRVVKRNQKSGLELRGDTRQQKECDEARDRNLFLQGPESTIQWFLE